MGHGGTARPRPDVSITPDAGISRTSLLGFYKSCHRLVGTIKWSAVSRLSRALGPHGGTSSSIDAMTDWFARPVLHVASVEASLRFYVDRLGFTVAWQFDEDGRVFVAQVDRGSCALIFSDQ